MTRYLLSPFVAWFITLLYAGLMGKDNLIQYAIGEEKILTEEYLIILAIVMLYNITITVFRRKKQ